MQYLDALCNINLSVSIKNEYTQNVPSVSVKYQTRCKTNIAADVGKLNCHQDTKEAMIRIDN